MGSISVKPTEEINMADDNWKHRSDGMRCKTCMFFVLKENTADVQVGRCRRHAPTMNGYPVVFTGDWCGDHKLDENAVRSAAAV